MRARGTRLALPAEAAPACAFGVRGIGMRLGIALGIASVVVAGCGLAQEPASDAGPIEGDAYVPPACTGDQMPPFYCAFVGSDHVCGDAEVAPTCNGSAWQCPTGTSPDSQCWCSGFVPQPTGCVCMPSGWSCPDPIDAGAPVCPADPRAAAGTPCDFEGQSCGSCTDPCHGLCDSIECINHQWSPLVVDCPPLFSCGGLRCQPHIQYCDHVVSDVAGEPDTFRCLAFPDNCPASCSCFAANPGQSCVDDGAGDIVLTLGGG